MIKMLCKATIFTFLTLVLFYIIDEAFNFNKYLGDSSSIGVFITAFGTMYGIVVGFIVIEVWSQKNDIQKLLEKEAKDIEGLYFLVHYFNDKKLETELKKRLLKYLNIVLKMQYESLISDTRNRKVDKIFRKIADLFDSIEFDEQQDPIIFDQMISQFKELRDTRTERIRESLVRIPFPIQMFITMSSFIVTLTMIGTPFESRLLHFLSVLFLSFFVNIIQQIINDLDNPFVGYWNVDFNPLKIAKKQLKTGR